MQDNNQTIKSFLAQYYPEPELDQASEKLTEIVMEDILKNLPEEQANKLRGQIENAATTEEMEATIKSANLDIATIVKSAIKKLTEEK